MPCHLYVNVGGMSNCLPYYLSVGVVRNAVNVDGSFPTAADTVNQCVSNPCHNSGACVVYNADMLSYSIRHREPMCEQLWSLCRV